MILQAFIAKNLRIDVRSVSCARKYMWLNISFILIQSNLTYSSNAIALNLENQPIKTGEYCNTDRSEAVSLSIVSCKTMNITAKYEFE